MSADKLELSWAVLTSNGIPHVVPYFGRKMAGWHDPKAECACGTRNEDGVIVHRLVEQ